MSVTTKVAEDLEDFTTDNTGYDRLDEGGRSLVRFAFLLGAACGALAVAEEEEAMLEELRRMVEDARP